MGWKDYLPSFSKRSKGKAEAKVQSKSAAIEVKPQDEKSDSGNGNYTFLVRRVEGDKVIVKIPRKIKVGKDEKPYDHLRLDRDLLYKICPGLSREQEIKRDDLLKYDSKIFAKYRLSPVKEKNLENKADDFESPSDLEVIMEQAEIPDDSDSFDIGSGEYDMKDDSSDDLSNKKS